jgi:hypothetical protein
MKCPLFRLAQLLQRREITWNDIDCLKEECAWWSSNSQQCYLGVLTGELYSLTEVMEEIRDQLSNLVKIISVKG